MILGILGRYFNRKKSIEDIEREMIDQSGICFDKYDSMWHDILLDGTKYSLRICEYGITVLPDNNKKILHILNSGERCKLYTKHLDEIMSEFRKIANKQKEDLKTEHHEEECLSNLWNKLTKVR